MEIQNQNPQAPKGEMENRVPTLLGVIIIILVVAVVALLTLKFQDLGQPVATVSTVKPTTVAPATQPVTVGTETAATTEPATTATETNTGGATTAVAVNFTGEIANLDNAVNSVSENDFNAGNLPDADLGL